MTPVISLRGPIVTRQPAPPDDLPPAIPELLTNGTPADWSYREAAGLRFERWRAERGDFDGDRFGLIPEPMPPIVLAIDPVDNGRNER